MLYKLIYLLLEHRILKAIHTRLILDLGGKTARSRGKLCNYRSAVLGQEYLVVSTVKREDLNVLQMHLPNAIAATNDLLDSIKVNNVHYNNIVTALLEVKGL